MLRVSDPELRALASGETIIAFVTRGDLTEGDEVGITSSGGLDPEKLKAAYRRWADAEPPHGDLTAIVVSVDPATILDPVAGASRHILMAPGDGDMAVVRVFDAAGPVLSDEAFEARRHSVEGALLQ